MNELAIFIAQYATIYLLGVQSLFVRDGDCYSAATGSVLIGLSQFFIFAEIGGLGPDDIGTGAWWAFILAGPLAIVTSIKTHPIIKSYLDRGRKK